MRTFTLLAALAAAALAQSNSSSVAAVSSSGATGAIVPTPRTSVSASKPRLTIPSSLAPGTTWIPVGPSQSAEISVGSTTTLFVNGVPSGYDTTVAGASPTSSTTATASSTTKATGGAATMQAAGAGALGLAALIAAFM